MENRKVYLDDHTNLLQLEEHMYPLVDVKTPNVFRNLFHYDEIPKSHSMTELFRIVCRMRSGSQIQHSEMANNHVPRTVLSRS